jgi:hypothetical protein
VARQEIDEILHDIRDMSKKYKTQNSFEQPLIIIMNFVEKATSNQSLMIIRCCGELVPSETPENRTKLVQEVWKTMENLSKILISNTRLNNNFNCLIRCSY